MHKQLSPLQPAKTVFAIRVRELPTLLAVTKLPPPREATVTAPKLAALQLKHCSASTVTVMWKSNLNSSFTLFAVRGIVDACLLYLLYGVPRHGTGLRSLRKSRNY